MQLVIELVIVGLVLLFLVTQIIIPLVQGRSMCPMFKGTARLERELEEANQQVYDANLAKEVEQVRNKTKTTLKSKE
jgi:hypothetical protein